MEPQCIPQRNIMTDIELVTGDLVLCTVGSYEPWPAVVVPQRILSKGVWKAKDSDNQVAVAFFNDSTYYWSKPKQLTKLTKQMLENWTRNPPKRSSKELKIAYQYAADYTDLNTFVRERLDSEGRKNVLDSLGIIGMGEDPLAATSVEVQFSVSRDRTPEKKINTQHEKLPANNLKRRRSPESNSTIENEAHLEEDVKAEGSRKGKQDSSESLLTSPSLAPEPTKKRSKLDHSRRIEIAQIFRNKLQKNLVQRDSPPSDDELRESEKMIRKIVSHLNTEPEFFDFEALSVSKLHKLIKVISNMPELAQFHDSCTLILEAWAPHIHQIKSEKLKIKEQQTHS